MPTPAEIIAARINGLDLSAQNEAPKVSKPAVSQTPKTFSINDENAFPVLGGGAKNGNGNSASSSWGPNLNARPTSAASAASLKSNSPGVLRTSTVQEAFSLDAEDQLNVARPEFVKILTAIKASTSAGIECTSSQHTKKRTFLITGKPEQVKQAKRLVIKKLSKPIVSTFLIPAKVRSRVIGAQGRNLKPIIQQTEVKIEIGNLDKSVSPEPVNDDDDLFAQTVPVVLEGDAESCKIAKSLIMEIVKEETKNAQTKIVVDERLKPFIANLVKLVADKYEGVEITAPLFGSSSTSIIILGARDGVISAKDEISQLLATFDKQLVVESVNIPKSKHQFLPVGQILEEDNVFIKIPTDDGEVQFIGERSKIASAKEKARQTTSQYKVESLDMSKAHKGNLAHVRAVASMLQKYGVFEQIATEYGLEIKAPSDAILADESNTMIPVEIIVNSNTHDAETIKNCRRAVVAAVNAISPSITKVIVDIDPFFTGAAIEVLDAFNGVKHVVLGDTITLFSANEASEGDDFDDFDDLSLEGLVEADRALNPFRSLQEGLVTEVMNIASADQKYISGPNGSTLKAVLSQFDSNAVQVKLHANASGNSPDEVFIKGFARDVPKIKKEFEEILLEVSESSKNGGYSTTVNVPAFILARLIGKGGSNIKEIVDEFGIELNVINENKNIDKTDKQATVEISIKGLKRSAEAAKSKVSALAKKLADDTIVKLRIENQFHKRISGPRFTSIDRLRKKYNVVILFPSDKLQSDAPQNKDEITIRGLSRNVAKAQEELMQLYQFEKENGFKTSLQIPKAAIGKVIGKNGSNIEDISAATGTELLFKDRLEEDEFAEVDIVGSKAGLKEATEKIQSIIEEVVNTITKTLKVDRKYMRDIVGQNGSMLRSLISKAGGDSLPRQQYGKLVTIPSNNSESDEIEFNGDKIIVEKLIKEIEALIGEKEAAVTENYELAKEKQRLLVGSLGSVRRSLQEEFGVQLIIPKPNEDSTIIQLVGLPEKIEKLKVKIAELTQDNWAISIDVPLAYHALVSDKGSIFSTLRLKYNVEVSHGNLNRKAFKTLDAIPVAPPAEAMGGGETTKFTTVALETEVEESDVIPWRLIGSDAETKEAAKIIETRLDQARNATHAAWLYSKTPANHFPKIIGPQGSKIRKIRDTTGCFITVPRDTHKYKDFVYFVGTEESLSKAHAQIQKLF